MGTLILVCSKIYLVISGSLLPGVDAEIYRKIIKKLKGNGVQVILDRVVMP